MIDHDDVDHALLAGMNGPVLWSGLCLILAIVFYVMADRNSDACEQKHCAMGKPQLMDHRCLCVEDAK